MSKAVDLLRETKSPIAIELACTLGEWWFNSKEYEKTIECMNECVQEHLVDGNDSGAANDLHLIGCAYRELKNYEKSLEAFKESRALFKKLKEVINVARCDQKIAHCLTELGDAEGALISAQKSLDVFVTAHDHRRETYSSFELGKAQIASGQFEEALMTLENVLENVTESEFKDFEFIIDIERKIAITLRKLDRDIEADKKIEERVIELQKTVNIKGFRPGKAPVDLLKKQFAQALYGEVLEKILQDNTYQALNDNKIKPASQPKIEIKSSGEDKDLEYTISVEKTPDIKKIELEKITLTDYKLKIEKKDLDDRINLLAEGQKKYVNKNEGETSIKGDLVVFDFEATVNGKAFEGNKGQKVQIILGKELFIKGFDEQLLTCKSGDKKDVKINLPENYPNKDLANKTAVFNCKILEVKKSESVVIDDQFAKNLGAKDLSDLKILLEKQLSKEQSSITETIVRKEILDYLDENCKFDLPEDLVKNEQEIVKHSFIHEKAHKDEPHDDHKHGHDHSDIKLTKEEEEDILDISKRRVKLALVLNQIGEDYKIQVTTQELQQELQKQMSMYPGQEKQIRDYYQKNPSEITRLRGPIYEDKIVELVKSKAKVTVKEVNKKELEELVKDLSSNLKSKSSAKLAKSGDDKLKKDTKSEDKSKSTKKISKK
jgi:trigger factor